MSETTLPPATVRTMTAEIARLLREPFPAEVVGKLPRIWCGACREARGKVCDKHQKIRCDGCRNTITAAHLHLDYVGHAETTDRFLAADPEWTWEPLAFDEHGLPMFDRHGGLWMRLTIAGVTRLGYGHADGKTGPDAVKESIGDGLRNAGMRFGVALDLWGATFKEDQHDPDPTPDASPSEAWGVNPAAIRSVIAKVGKSKGMQPDQLAADFTEWSKGVHIAVTEDTRLLSDYLTYLQEAPA